MCTMDDIGQGEWQLFPPLSTAVEAVVRRLPRDAGIDDVYAAILETQCGATDDSRPVEQYDGTLGVTTAFVNAHQAPVGQTQWNNNLAAIYTNPGNVSGVRWCTGALISDNLFLTAGHCFEQLNGPPSPWTVPRINGTNTPIPRQEIATNMHVNFNFQVDPTGNLRPEQAFAIEGLIEDQLGGLDFAILRLAGNPGQIFGTGVIATADPQQNDMICIIGHPAGEPKRIEASPVSNLVNNQVRYNDIDTLGGNSGAAIWHSLPAQSWAFTPMGDVCRRAGASTSGYG